MRNIEKIYSINDITCNNEYYTTNKDIKHFKSFNIYTV